ncbi:MAG: KpsF/GutQ family sugar-phosphate isomerase [Rikenellaceae bacterium]
MESCRADKIIAIGRDILNKESQALESVACSLGESFAQAVEIILACQGKVIITGIGKSGHVGRKIAATLASTGTPSFFLHPAEAFHGDLGMISSGDVVLALSFSGESDELIKLIPSLQEGANPIISITGNPKSTLAKYSTCHIDIAIKSEACILNLAPTTSTTVQLAVGDALSMAVMQQRGFTAVDFAKRHPGGSLGRRLLMRVESVMRRDRLPIASPDCSAKDMIHKISCAGLGLLVVCQDDKVTGIITDGDIRRAMESREADFFNLVASDIATPSPKSIDKSEMLITAEGIMTQNKVNSLLVVDKERHLEGVIQIYDIKL